MNVIAFMNLKGGTAKTTTTVNTAAILARDYGQRVLVVDADSQGNTTEFLGLGRSCCAAARLSSRPRPSATWIYWPETTR